MYMLDEQEKNIYTLSSHRATREPSHRAPVGALYERSMRRELYAALQSCPSIHV